MFRRLAPESLASASARHPVRTLVVWVLALVLGFMASSALLDSALTGDAKLTKGYRLHARHVIHTVGPVWRGGTDGEPALLASCYRRSIEFASANGILTLAFPSISTGIYGYPIELAAKVAVATVRSAVVEFAAIQEVVFCCFSTADLAVYAGVLDESNP